MLSTPSVHKFEHRDKRELHHRHTRSSACTSALLILQQMRCVVGADGCDASVDEGFAQCVAVGSGLDGRVALYACAEASVVVLCEYEVSYDCLCRDAWRRAEQLQLACCGHVCHMQTCTCLLSEVYGALCRLVARCLGAYLRVVLNGGVVAVLLLCVLHVAVDDVGILAVSHQRQCRLAEQFV